MTDLSRQPIRLTPDNFTPPTRTPWGGRRILDAYKRDLRLAPHKRDYAVVGESWEISVDPAFPSTCVLPDGRLVPLPELIASDPLGIVGPSAERYGGSTPMLVKLLDADDELSVQVHPSDDYAALAADESGKPECWFVVGAERGAGLYLGLAPGVTRDGLARAMTAGEDLRAMLNFVPVWPGDMFVIEPGTVHAIGRGVTLVEPQLIVPGRSGKTYRFWDWNRRYDAAGRLDPGGTPRELHIEHSLAVTRFDGPRGEAFVDATRREPRMLHVVADARHERLARLGEMSVERLVGHGTLPLDAPGTLVGVVVTAGALTFEVDGRQTRVATGEPCLLPARMPDGQVHLAPDTEAVLTRI